MNILHVVRSPVSVKCFLLKFLNAQKAQGHNVAVACNAEEDASEIKANGIEVCPYEIARSLSISNIFRAFRSLGGVITSTHFDLIIVHMPLAAAITRIVAKICSRRSKVIYVCHGLPCAPHQSVPRWLFWFLAEWLLGKLTDALFVMNKYDYELARRTRILSRCELIRRIPGMGVDLGRFTPQQETQSRFWQESLGIDGGKKIILFAGRMIREKGVFELLEAARLLKNRNYVFVLAGEGPVYSTVCEFIKKHGLTGTVFLPGWREDLDCLMRHCDIFALPTYYFEGLPVTILEAMASAKPVIATRHRGCEDEVIDGLTGFLVEVKNVHQLAEKIDVVLTDESLAEKMGVEGRRRVERYFSRDKAVRCFFEEVTAVGKYWGWQKDVG